MDSPSMPLVTVLMSPRERFSVAEDTIANIFDNTSMLFELVVVDGGYPPHLRRRLESSSRRRAFRLVRTDHYLSPNEARNLALSEVKTRYIAFVDNDLVVAPGWLEALVRCAEETGADVVSPVICIGKPLHTIIHIAGGTVDINRTGDRRALSEVHLHSNARLDAVRHRLRREETGLAEFHCMLVRRSVFDRLGKLDEGLKATSEHIDLCLKVRQSGGKVFLEPDATVTYVPPPPLAVVDVPYYLLRWSDEWCVASEKRLAETWNVDVSPDVLAWTPMHRRSAYPRIMTVAQRLLGWNRSMALLTKVERAVANRAESRRTRAHETGAETAGA
jgi:glycosyltransferase involved in cell wall biosynthesis